MSTRLASLPYGIVDQLHRQFASRITVEEARKLHDQPDLWDVMFQALREQPAFKLIHGVFNRSEDVLKATMERLIEKGFTVDQFTWIGPETPPYFTQDNEVVVVLGLTLDTLQSTIEFAYEWATEGQQNGGWRWEGLSTDPDKLRLLQGSESFQPFTLRWRRIKLNANIGKKPVDVRSPETSPGIALVFVAAQHPERVKAINYRTRFGWYIPGLECTVSNDEPWERVLCVQFHRDEQQVWLSARWFGDAIGVIAVPVLRE